MTPPVQVAKVGGTLLDHPGELAALAAHVGSVRAKGRRIVLVHGGGKELAELRHRAGVGVRGAPGLRVTTNRAMDLATMVLCGLANKRIVAALAGRGFCALGLSGVDFGFMRSALLNRSRLGRVGGPPRIDDTHVRRLLDTGCVLVVAPVCLGPDDGLVDVDADTVAQSLAVALGAEALDFVSDVDAVRNEDGPIHQIAAADLDELVSGPAVQGGMVPKLQAALVALEGGVARVCIGSFGSLARGEATVMRR